MACISDINSSKMPFASDEADWLRRYISTFHCGVRQYHFCLFVRTIKLFCFGKVVRFTRESRQITFKTQSCEWILTNGMISVCDVK